MVFALYIVALAMVAGGLSAIYLGSDIIVMERGWTMVISGAVIAAAGALLAGVATAVARLQAIEHEFAVLRDRLARSDFDAATAQLAAPRRSAPPRGAGGAAMAAAGLTASRDFELPPEPRLGDTPVAAGPAPGQPAPVPAGHEAALIEAEGGKAAAGAQAGTVTTPESSEAAGGPTVVGTYNSGGNFYIMYSDGSIEAETPAGKFRFLSLDELKDFIAAGGDKAKARPA
ncbi:MAG TPA: hypothetical protein VHN20_00780 [Beijerinckiaceae bacterium]|nr:hypothetical protein [Beijerinckiaceae bacterium]